MNTVTLMRDDINRIILGLESMGYRAPSNCALHKSFVELAEKLKNADKVEFTKREGGHFRVKGSDGRFKGGEFPSWKAASEWARQHGGFRTIVECDRFSNPI